MDQDIKQTDSARSKIGSGFLFLWDFLKVIIIALVIILPIRYFIFQPFIVSGSSMEPNFENGQYLIIDELSYRFHEPHRGDVLVLKPPSKAFANSSDSNEYFIKRIIGLPGEKISVDDGHVTVYNNDHPEGFVLDEVYLPNQGLSFPHNNTIVGGKNIITLKSNEYFMMGDNRLASSDSRDWGPLTTDRIVGKVFIRALPITTAGVIKGPAYSTN